MVKMTYWDNCMYVSDEPCIYLRTTTRHTRVLYVHGEPFTNCHFLICGTIFQYYLCMNLGYIPIENWIFNKYFWTFLVPIFPQYTFKISIIKNLNMDKKLFLLVDPVRPWKIGYKHAHQLPISPTGRSIFYSP